MHILKNTALVIGILWVHSVYPQVTLISEFLWDSNPVTTANVGPNGTSVSGSAGSTAGGVGGTNGLNARACCAKADINLTIPGSPTFDVGGIDIWIDFKRRESVGDFFTRGSSLRFGMNSGNLFVTYRVDNGMGGFNTVSSGSIFAIPTDNNFRTFRFYYDPPSGIGEVFVNGASVWSNDGPDNRNLYWTGSGNVIIGSQMDATGENIAIFDNLRIFSVTNILLPVEWLSFHASYSFQESKTLLTWATASEQNNDFFSVERSYNAENWYEVGRIKGAGNSSTIQEYHAFDVNPPCGTLYYRLKQTDFNGDFKYSEVQAVKVSCANSVRVFPNPANQTIGITMGDDLDVLSIELYNITGSKMLSSAVNSKVNSFHLDVETIPNGIYFLVLETQQQRIVEKVVVEH